jgi:hypothetical protein
MKNRNVGLGPPDQVSSYGINAVFDLMPLGDVPQVGCEGRSLSGAARGSPVQASAGAYGQGRELFGDVGSGTPRVGGTLRRPVHPARQVSPGPYAVRAPMAAQCDRIGSTSTSLRRHHVVDHTLVYPFTGEENATDPAANGASARC